MNQSTNQKVPSKWVHLTSCLWLWQFLTAHRNGEKYHRIQRNDFLHDPPVGCCWSHEKATDLCDSLELIEESKGFECRERAEIEGTIRSSAGTAPEEAAGASPEQEHVQPPCWVPWTCVHEIVGAGLRKPSIPNPAPVLGPACPPATPQFFSNHVPSFLPPQTALAPAVSASTRVGLHSWANTTMLWRQCVRGWMAPWERVACLRLWNELMVAVRFKPFPGLHGSAFATFRIANCDWSYS